MSRCRCTLPGLVMLACLATSVPLEAAAEPRVAFTLKNGWVEFAVQHDGRPVPDVRIQVLDERGHKFADGEAGADGQGAFPLPAGSSFDLEITSGTRTADPIRLVKTDTGIEPARVLLSYGLRPCCRGKLSKESPSGRNTAPPPTEETQEPAFSWPVLALSGMGIILAGMAIWWARRYSLRPVESLGTSASAASQSRKPEAS